MKNTEKSLVKILKSSPTNEEADFSFSSAVSYGEKDEYLTKKLAFVITAIEMQAGRGFDGADRWAVTVEPADGRGAQVLTFTCNEKRDALLSDAKAHIEQRGPIRDVILTKSGNAYYFRNFSETKVS